MPALKPQLTKWGKLLYWIYRESATDNNGAHIEMTPKQFIDSILCGPVATYTMECLSCGQVGRVHVATFCVECCLGAIDKR